MIYIFLTSWLFGSFLYSKSLEGDWSPNGNDNISVWPPLFFMLYAIMACTVVASTASSIDWQSGISNWSQVPFAFIGYMTFLTLDLMFSSVTSHILFHVVNSISNALKFVFKYIYYKEDPEILYQRIKEEHYRRHQQF